MLLFLLPSFLLQLLQDTFYCIPFFSSPPSDCLFCCYSFCEDRSVNSNRFLLHLLYPFIQFVYCSLSSDFFSFVTHSYPLRQYQGWKPGSKQVQQHFLHLWVSRSLEFYRLDLGILHIFHSPETTTEKHEKGFAQNSLWSLMSLQVASSSSTLFLLKDHHLLEVSLIFLEKSRCDEEERGGIRGRIESHCFMSLLIQSSDVSEYLPVSSSHNRLMILSFAYKSVEHMTPDDDQRGRDRKQRIESLPRTFLFVCRFVFDMRDEMRVEASSSFVSVSLVHAWLWFHHPFPSALVLWLKFWARILLRERLFCLLERRNFVAITFACWSFVQPSLL